LKFLAEILVVVDGVGKWSENSIEMKFFETAMWKQNRGRNGIVLGEAQQLEFRKFFDAVMLQKGGFNKVGTVGEIKSFEEREHLRERHLHVGCEGRRFASAEDKMLQRSGEIEETHWTFCHDLDKEIRDGLNLVICFVIGQHKTRREATRRTEWRCSKERKEFATRFAVGVEVTQESWNQRGRRQ